MNIEKPVVSITEDEDGEKIVYINGIQVETFEDNGVLVPLNILEDLKLSDLKMFEEVGVLLLHEDEKYPEYAFLLTFSELRISFFGSDDCTSAYISVVVFDPNDIEELEFHEEYQKQLEQELIKYNDIEIWMHPISDIDSIIETKNEYDKVNKEKGTDIGYDHVGYVGFHLKVDGTDFKSLIYKMINFLKEVDNETRQNMKV